MLVVILLAFAVLLISNDGFGEAVSYQDCLEIYQLEPGASEETVRKVYLRQAVKWHPDKNPDPQAASLFRIVKKCLELLKLPPPASISKVQSFVVPNMPPSKRQRQKTDEGVAEEDARWFRPAGGKAAAGKKRNKRAESRWASASKTAEKTSAKTEEHGRRRRGKLAAKPESAPTGRDICEGRGWNQTVCDSMILCCVWESKGGRKAQCWSGISRNPCPYYDVSKYAADSELPGFDDVSDGQDAILYS
eukprot:gnl/TRDRNA2_/TRDRNA2_202819_c0_seq1.p1 gnl/TRDRNA2_/TRDRNA2_202819_c0~~gnl/TRDRNA2_/TRDRNA2_202819_c0_seq1.p1  ORF type:complete len:248 (-),score=31.36 gnl/TRDRNA2_/TRDRNA2_202819_c0_seq1:242-985(-)